MTPSAGLLVAVPNSARRVFEVLDQRGLQGGNKALASSSISHWSTFLPASPAIRCQNSSPSSSPVASRLNRTCARGPVARLPTTPAASPCASRTAAMPPALGPAATTRWASGSEKYAFTLTWFEGQIDGDVDLALPGWGLPRTRTTLLGDLDVVKALAHADPVPRLEPLGPHVAAEPGVPKQEARGLDSQRMDLRPCALAAGAQPGHPALQSGDEDAERGAGNGLVKVHPHGAGEANPARAEEGVERLIPEGTESPRRPAR